MRRNVKLFMRRCISPCRDTSSWPWLFALACLAAAFSPLLPLYSGERENTIGACLLYGAKGASAYNMPGMYVLVATLDSLRSLLLFRACDIAINCGILAVSYSIGRELASPKAGLLAALFSALCMTSNPYFGDLEQRLLSLELLCALFYFLRDERSPSRSCQYAGAVMIGCSFMLRSTMALFPPVWGLWALLRGGRDNWRVRWKEVLPVVLLPYLFLVPWMFSSHFAMQRNVVFEDGRAHSNMVTGALGMVGTIEGSAQKLAALNGWREGESLTLWAVKQVLSHPWRYVSAVAARVGQVALFCPMAALLGGAGCVVLLIKVRLVLPLVFCLYFVAVHCLMTVEPRYFVPLWLVCMPISGAAIFAFHRDGHTRALSSGRMAGAVFFSVAALGVWIAILLLAYPLRIWARNTTCMEAAVRHDYYALWDCALRENLVEGRKTEVENSARRMVASLPDRLAWRRQRELEALSIYDAAGGNPLIWRAILADEWQIAKILGEVDRGVPCSELPAQCGLRLYFRTLHNEADKTSFFKMSAVMPVGLHENLLRSNIPREDLAEVERRLAKCGLDNYSIVSNIAEGGAREEGTPQFNDEFHPDHLWLLHRAAIYCQEKEWRRVSVVLYTALMWAYPANPRFPCDRGVAKWLLGDARGAAADFRRALAVDPGFLPAVNSLESITGKAEK